MKAVTVKSPQLTKKSCKNLVRGTKVSKVKLKGAAKQVKTKYKNRFPKNNAGKKFVVSG